MKTKTYTIQDSQVDSNGILRIWTKPILPENKIDFKPGQYMMLSYIGDNRLGRNHKFHSFSVSSSPTSDHLEFAIKIAGQFTQGLAGLMPGDIISVRGPFGSFVPKKNDNKDHVYLAAGIGITPFVSMLSYAHATNQSNNIGLLYSVKTAENIPYYDEIKTITNNNPKIKALFTVTGKEEIPSGFLSGRITADHIKSIIPNSLDSTRFYICGPSPFLSSTKSLLKQMGIKRKNIYDESFIPSPWMILEEPITFTVGATSIAISVLAFITIFNANNVALGAQKSALKLDNIFNTTNVNSSFSKQRNDLIINQSEEVVQVPMQRTVMVPSQTTQPVVITKEIQTMVPGTSIPQAQTVVVAPKPVVTPKPVVVSKPTTSKPTANPPSSPTPTTVVKPKPTPAPAPVVTPKPPPPRTQVS
ncbi:MAG: FAD-dependent oxidoreductase [Candidatus Magasanikiibacteriota bacterium]